jgi:hypothetical protein
MEMICLDEWEFIGAFAMYFWYTAAFLVPMSGNRGEMDCSYQQESLKALGECSSLSLSGIFSEIVTF